MLQRSKYFTNILEQFHIGLCTFAVWLLEFYVLFRIPNLDEEFPNPVTMVTLQHNLTILRRSTTSTKRLQLLRYVCEVRVSVIHAVNNRGRSAKLSCLKPDANPLLLFFDFATNT
jgi:hypothetical protein